MNDSNLLSPNLKKICLNKMEYLKTYLHHYKEYTQNKQHYLNMIDNIKSTQCVLSLDYKEKPKVGHKAEEQGWVFHQLKLRNLLGFIFEFDDRRIVIDAVTNIQNQTGLLSNALLLFALNHAKITEIFRLKKIDRLDVWMDTGTHFYNKSTLHCILYNYPQINQQMDEIHAHFHTVHHGKTYVDGHFGSVSKWVELYTTINEMGVQNTQDLCDSIKRGVSNQLQQKKSIKITIKNM